MSGNRVQVIIAGENQVGGVLTQVGSQLDGFASKLGGLEGILEKLAVVEVTRKLAEFGAQTLESEANLAKMAQRTGVAVEQLSELAYAANLSGLSTEQLEKGIKKLQTTLSNAAAGNQQAANALASVGVNAKDAQGKTLGAADALEKIAQKFAATKDGSDKAALAVQIFGKAGTQLIPLLDKGSAGIAQLREEAHRLGVTLTEEDAAAAEEAEQAFKRLEAESRGMMQHFLSGLLPALTAVTDAMTTDVEGFDAAKESGESLGRVVKLLYEGFEALGTVAAIVGQKLLLVAEAGIALSKGDLAGATESMKEFFGVVKDGATEELITRLGKIDDALWGDKTTKPKGESTSADLDRQSEEKDAVRKARLKNQMEAEKLAAEFSKSINDLELKNIEELYKHELISVQDYFAKKQALQADSLRAEIFAAKQELALQDQESKKGKTEQDRIAALGQVNKLTEEITVKTAQLNAVLNKKPDGSDDPLAERARQMEIYAAEATRLQEKIDHVYSRLADDIAAVTTAERNRQLTQAQAEAQINALNENARDDVRGMVTEYQKLAAASGDRKLIDNAEKLKAKYEELGHSLNWVRDTAVDSLDSSLSNLFSNLRTGADGALDSFRKFGLGLIDMIGQIIDKMLAMYIIEKLLGLFLSSAMTVTPEVTANGTGQFGDFTSGMGSFGIGGHAMGGHMNAGELSWVGEKGIELFKPDVSGSVIPLDKMLNGDGGTTNYFDFRGADPGSENRIMAAMRQVGIIASNAGVSKMSDMKRRGMAFA